LPSNGFDLERPGLIALNAKFCDVNASILKGPIGRDEMTGMSATSVAPVPFDPSFNVAEEDL
jgi:hypothetical protein